MRPAARSLLSVLTAVLLTAGLIGCSAEQRPAATITATLVGPTDIRLDWHAAPSGALGQVVQYRDHPNGQFITLAFLPARATSYTHARLIPKTTFSYRVRAFFGEQTAPVTATLPTNTPAAPPSTTNPLGLDPRWAEPRTLPGPHTVQHSLRHSDDGGPTDLRAQPVGSDGVRLTWADHTDDADGYLVEVTPENSTSTRVAAVLGPRINQVGIYPLPNERSAAYRVVAFYYGPPSPTVGQTTG